MSEDPPVGLVHGHLRVDGAATDWIHPIEDCVYDYLVDQWSIDKPLQANLKEKNRAYDGNGQYHFWIVRQKTTAMQDEIGGKFYKCVSTLQINVLMKRLNKGQVNDNLDEMCREIRQLLINYSPDWIAGINYFDNFIEIPRLHHPEDENNPFTNTWISAMTVDAHFYYVTDFTIDTTPYNPSQHNAGELSYKFNNP